MNQGPIIGRRPYQSDALQKVIRGFEGAHEGRGPFRRQLGVLATGGGKTIIFADVAAHYAALGQSVLVLADQRELVNQAAEKMLDFGGLFAEIEQGSRHASPDARVVVASMQTLVNQLDKPWYRPDRFGLVVADEADRAMAPQWQKVLGHFAPHAKIFGLTATPERADKKSVLTFFEDVAFERNLYDLIGEGYLSPVTVRQEALKIDLTQVASSTGENGESDYNRSQLGELLEPCFDQICQLLIKHARDKGRRKVLAFLPIIETSKKFVEACFRNGINARHVDGTMPNRDEIVAAHKRGDFWLLSNAMMLGRGYDDPAIDTILPLRFTKSASLYRQFIGRGTRLYCPHRCAGKCQHEDRKKDVLVFDFLFAHGRLGPQRPSNLIAATPTEAESINKVLEKNAYGDKPMDLEFASDTAAREREIALLKQLEKVGKRKSKTFDAQAFAIRLKQRDLIDYEPMARWEQQPPSPKQISLLAKWGFSISSIKSKGHATKLLNVVFGRQRDGMASFGKVKFLNSIGDPLAEKRTRKQADEILSRFNMYKQGKIPKSDVFPSGTAMPEPTPESQTKPESQAGGYDTEEEYDEAHLAALATDKEEASQSMADPKPDFETPASPDRVREAMAQIREKLEQTSFF